MPSGGVTNETKSAVCVYLGVSCFEEACNQLLIQFRADFPLSQNHEFIEELKKEEQLRLRDSMALVQYLNEEVTSQKEAAGKVAVNGKHNVVVTASSNVNVKSNNARGQKQTKEVGSKRKKTTHTKQDEDRAEQALMMKFEAEELDDKATLNDEWEGFANDHD